MATKWTKEPGLYGPRGPRQTLPEAGSMETNTAGPGDWGMCVGGGGWGWGWGFFQPPRSVRFGSSSRELHCENRAAYARMYVVDR